MKQNSVIAGSACWFFAGVALLLSVIQFCAFDRSFYRMEYRTYKTNEEVGMSEEDLMRATDVLLDYIQSKCDDVMIETEIFGEYKEVYSADEAEHMIDIRNLYKKGLGIRNTLSVVVVIGFVYLIFRNRSSIHSFMKSGFTYGISLLLLMLVFLGIWVIADFYDFWYTLHEILFPQNTLWLLDPNVSTMINMFPTEFFSDMVLRILVVFFGFITVTALVIWLPWRKIKNDSCCSF